MLTRIDKSEIPSYRPMTKSDIRRFASEQLDEFMSFAEVGDVAEVTGAPDVKAKDEIERANKVRSAFASEAFSKGLKNEVKPFRRSTRVFIERVEPWAPRRSPRTSETESRGHDLKGGRYEG